MPTLSEQVAALETERAMYEAQWRRADHERTELRVALATARVEGAREAAESLIEFVRTWRGFDADVAGECGPSTGSVLLRELRRFRDREYPAAPRASEGEEYTKAERECRGCHGPCGQCPTPQAAPERVTLSDGRVVKWTRWEYRNGVECDHRTLDLVTNLDKPGCESRRCFGSLAEMREKVTLKWADWQTIDTAFAVSLAAQDGGTRDA